MIQVNQSLDKELIIRLQDCDPVVSEYRAFFRFVRLEPGDRTR